MTPIPNRDLRSCDMERSVVDVSPSVLHLIKFTLRQWMGRVKRAHIIFSHDDWGGSRGAGHRAQGAAAPLPPRWRRPCCVTLLIYRICIDRPSKRFSSLFQTIQVRQKSPNIFGIFLSIRQNFQAKFYQLIQSSNAHIKVLSPFG